MIVQVFLISGLISFLGTIPPATINVTVLQLSIKSRIRQAWGLALGATIIDCTYASLSVQVASYLEQHVEFSNYFLLIAAIVLLFLGTISVFSKINTEVKALENQSKVGFVQGLVLGVFNPLAMPFWLGWISILQMNGWVNLEGWNYIGFVLGAFVGEFGLLILIIRIGERYTKMSHNHLFTNVVPGVILIGLGLYNFVGWLSFYW